MESKKILIGNETGHIHNWVAYGKTKCGKQRYKCTVCKKTCTEFSSDLAKLYYLHNLRLIHNRIASDDMFVWDEVFNYGEKNEIEGFEEKPYYKVNKRTVNWKQFQRIIRSRKFHPLVVYTVEDSKNSTLSDLCIFEVVFDV